MRNILLIGTLAVGAVALGVGCVAHAQATGYSEADAPVVFVEEPTLVAVEPDVWVVRDYDYAVYYVDDYYWVYRGDVWHRSRTYQGGWTTVEVNVIPTSIVRRDHHAYVHYHGVANAQVRAAPRERVAAAGPVENPRRDPPGHADDHHDGPRPPDKDRATLPERADDHHDAPRAHDDRGGASQRHEDAENDGKKENARRDDNVKKEEPKRVDQKKVEKRKRGDRK